MTEIPGKIKNKREYSGSNISQIFGNLGTREPFVPGIKPYSLYLFSIFFKFSLYSFLISNIVCFFTECTNDNCRATNAQMPICDGSGTCVGKSKNLFTLTYYFFIHLLYAQRQTSV